MWKLAFLSVCTAGMAMAGSVSTPLPRVVVADVVAFETPIVYNRFGSLNPYGMVYALQDQVEPLPGGRWTMAGLNCPGAWRFKAGQRPRPLVLRGNVGDVLEVRFTNRLLPPDRQPDVSRCAAVPSSPYAGVVARAERAARLEATARQDVGTLSGPGDWPRTRLANLTIPGVTVRPGGSAHEQRVCRGLEGVAPGKSVVCRFQLERPGTHLFSSTSAPAGGEGDGGSLTHGLFGALHVERRGSRYFHSQVTAQELNRAWPGRTRGAALDYGALELLKRVGQNQYVLTGSDLYAIILDPPPTASDVLVSDDDVQKALADLQRQGTPSTPAKARAALVMKGLAQARRAYGAAPAFREFTAIFHDELKTFYADSFAELGENPQLNGVKDGFGLNYGASGMGSILLANRLGIGPAANCVECLYEEFFLQSWANGDPALLEQYRQDPSNVFHSYLNDRVAFRNLHAGPKETHVFHLHAHQWLSASDEDRGSYLDSQTIGPMQGFEYSIYSGGLARPADDHRTDHEATHGSGNRNRTVGDSIFHCHLYPHFAQGMWALWRTHDVFEDGTRTLPDGQPTAGLSLVHQEGQPRPGTDIVSGRAGPGTPVPAVVPLPHQALPPLPTYGNVGLPGYPFFVPGTAGHRAPQPPLDLADDAGLPRHTVLNGVRQVKAAPHSMNQSAHDPHAAHTAVQRSLALADFTAELTSLKLNLLPLEGTPLERRTMQFHAGQYGRQPLPTGTGYGVLRKATTGQVIHLDREPQPVNRAQGYSGYPSWTPEGRAAPFTVNGAPPQPGAPFADPCGAPRDSEHTTLGTYLGDRALKGFRRYDVSAIQLDLIVNKEGWHDPQGRINVLSGTPNAALRDKAAYFSNALKREARGDAKAEPFFFRAQSGECVTYYHSNRIPKDLERDDFQMRTPTDIIGQHIHLVKFDVTSSDGSGNGWNYEDGTLAPDAVLERKCADTTWRRGHGLAARFTDASTALCGHVPAFGTAAFAALPVQTSVQRWFADPIVTVGRTLGPPTASMPGMTHPVPDSVKQDRTLRTVFTHDHFAPSSIQQHGFYSALLIEPFVRTGDPQLANAWLRPDGRPLADAQGQAVGWQAILRNAEDRATHRDQREFALAIADFALLYEPRPFTPRGPVTSASLEGRQGLDRLLAEATLAQTSLGPPLVDKGKLTRAALSLKGAAAEVQKLRKEAGQWWSRNGRPVDPPAHPEAISADHHNPFLVNYRQEPIPLRLGVNTGGPENTRCGQTLAEQNAAGQPYFSVRRVQMRQSASVAAQWPDARGDPAEVFRSATHGDPCTPILEAYEGELAQFRLVQGAQEVQHVFTVEGLTWQRLPDYQAVGVAPDGEVATGKGAWPYSRPWKRDNPLGLTNAQEVGISEHFEAVLEHMPGRDGNAPMLDRLYHFGSQDALWNGAWGLIRTYNGTDRPDPRACPDTEGRANPTLTIPCQPIGRRLESVDPNAVGNITVDDDSRQKVFPRAPERYLHPDGTPYTQNTLDAATQASCPVVEGGTTRILDFSAAATRVDLLFPASGGLNLNPAAGIRDPDALILLPLTSGEVKALKTSDVIGKPVMPFDSLMKTLRQKPLEPFVLRAAAGDCVRLTVYNALLDPHTDTALPDHRGDAAMPTIVPLNVTRHPSDMAQVDAVDCDPVKRTGSCARDLRPSSKLLLAIPRVAVNPNYEQSTLNVGWNPENWTEHQGGVNPPDDQGFVHAQQLLFYAGEVHYEPTKVSGTYSLRVRPYDFGPLPLRAYSDVTSQGTHGLYGTVIIEPQGAKVMRTGVDNPAVAYGVPPELWHTLGSSAFICTSGNAATCAGNTGAVNGFQEHVIGFRDGLNLWWRGGPIGHCPVCDDSYDLGDRAFDLGTAPFWARLHGTQGTRVGSNLNQAVFPASFLTPRYASIPTRTLRALAGQDVRLRVVQVDGRARQHALVVTGFSYEDQLFNFGSPHSALVAPGKAFTARLQNPQATITAGCYLYRDGPAMFFAAGMWGLLDVRSPVHPTVSRCG